MEPVSGASDAHLWKAEDAAAFLQVNVETVYDMVKAGTLGGFLYLGPKTLRFYPPRVREWVERQCSEGTVPEVAIGQPEPVQLHRTKPTRDETRNYWGQAPKRKAS